MAKRKKPTGSPGYIPPKERREIVKKANADRKLDRFIRDNPEGDRRNTEASPIQDVVLDMPKKFQKSFENKKGILDIPNYSDMNAQQKYLFGIYDNRNKYQRDMNNIRTSSQPMMDAYARKFPIENFAMKAGPMIAGAATGIPFGLMDLYNKSRNKTAEGINTLSERGDVFGAITRTGQDIINSLTPEQAKNIDINIGSKTDVSEQLKKANIIKGNQTPLDPQFSNEVRTSDLSDDLSTSFLDTEDPMEAVMRDFPGDDPLVYDPNPNPYPLESREYNEFEQFKKFKESQEQNDNFEQVEDGVFQRPGEVNLEKFGPDEFGEINIFGGDPDSEVDVAELTQEQIDFMNSPMQSLDFQSRDSLFNKVKQLEDKGFLGFGAQEPTTKEEFEQFINSGGLQTAARGGSIDNYENMSTHEKLMRMAAEMYG